MLPESKFLNLAYFETLRNKINKQLERVKPDLNQKEKAIVDDQIHQFKWLYGALGQVPSDVMFIAENPSITGVKHAHIDTVDQQPPDIEAQWWGGKNDKCAKVFRPVLCDLGLKTSPPNEKGGWNCYITNVIKQANYAKFQEKVSSGYRKQQGNYWSDILRWEIETVNPKVIFCLGKNSETVVRRLIQEGRIQDIPVFYVLHYSARDSFENIRNAMKAQIEEGIALIL